MYFGDGCGQSRPTERYFLLTDLFLGDLGNFPDQLVLGPQAGVG